MQDIVPNRRPIPRLSWLSVLARLWCLRRIDFVHRGNSVAAGVLLGTSLLAAWVAIDWWQRQPEPEFDIDGVPLLAWYVLGVLATAVLMRWRAKPQPPIGAAIVLTLGLVPIPLLLVSVLGIVLETPWFWCASFMAAVYSLVYLARGLRAVTGRPQRMAAVAGGAFIALFIGVSDAVDAIPDVWNPRDADASTPSELLAERETALFEQADRIDEALESIHRSKSPDPETFFLGFAGVGDEKVFAQEIGLASRVLRERYGIGDKGLSLVNDERYLGHAPLASVSGLAYALHGLASHMELDRDVLFLSISSHGSDGPVIAVSNSRFPFKDLTAEDLADAFRAAGIKWRVIIISACYAGGFIESLRDPQTILITAAAADRASFGCSNDSDLTYFGEAFYRDALPDAHSLRDAFEKAKEAIAARERSEGETPSNPQAYFGSEIEEKLSDMDTTKRPMSRPDHQYAVSGAPVAGVTAASPLPMNAKGTDASSSPEL